jgi:hypothetical protein
MGAEIGTPFHSNDHLRVACLNHGLMTSKRVRSRRKRSLASSTKKSASGATMRAPSRCETIAWKTASKSRTLLASKIWRANPSARVASCTLCLLCIGSRPGRIHEHGDSFYRRQQVTKDSKLLCHRFGTEQRPSRSRRNSWTARRRRPRCRGTPAAAAAFPAVRVSSNCCNSAPARH